MSKKITILFIFGLFLIAGVGFYYFYFQQSEAIPILPITENKGGKTEPVCLSDDEYAEKIRAHQLPTEIIEPPKPIYISVKDRNTKEEKFNFQIDSVRSGTHPLEVHNCGVYVMRGFDFDKKKSFYTRYELWKYNYQGEGIMLMSSGELNPYSLSFRIDPTETYITLEKGWIGEPENYTLVIKNLKTLEDEFGISLANLISKYQIDPGIFVMSGWDEKRFGFQIHNKEIPVFNIEKETWKIERVF